MRYIIISLVVLIASCKTDNSQSHKIKDSQTTTETKSLPKTDLQNQLKDSLADATTNAITAESLKPKPPTNIQNHTFIPAFVEYIETIYCAPQNKKGVACYKMHDAGVKSDFLNKMPMTLNFPYNQDIDWSSISKLDGFEQYWSNKCGFMNEETGEVVSYYCLNTSGSTRPWLDSLSKTNSLVKEFTNFYYDATSFLPDFQGSFALTNSHKLDYQNIDHRAFYWMYHLGLREESKAATQTRNW